MKKCKHAILGIGGGGGGESHRRGIATCLFTLDKKFGFHTCRKSVGFSTQFICWHKISPYPLPDMCRKCEEMSCVGSLGHVGNLNFGLVLSVKDARLNLKTYLMAQSD